MSVEAIGWALTYAPDVPPALVAVLIGLADHADPAGRGAAASQRRLAHYARKSERTIRRDLVELERLGLIRRGDQRRVAYLPPDRRPVVYDLAVERRHDVPADIDVHAVPQAGRPAANAPDIHNRADVHDRPVADVPSAAAPGGRPRPPARTSTSPRSTNREDAHVRRTQMEEEVPPPPPNHSTAATLLAGLPDPWHIGRRTIDQLAPAVAAALADGWTVTALTEHLTANATGVRSHAAVLRTRLRDLPPPPKPATPAAARAACPDHPNWHAGNCAACRSERLGAA